MTIGISTSCFYPLETEKSLPKVAKLGASVTEIFFNSPSELETPFIEKLCRIKDENNIRVKSIHSFASHSDNYTFFSPYVRRFDDGTELLKKYFNAMNMLGADVFVFHGAKQPLTLGYDEIFSRFEQMVKLGKQFGIKVAQENVYKYCSGDNLYLMAMADYLGSDFHMVLDIKQALLSETTPEKLIELFGKSIVQVHLSDHTAEKSCIPPGEGIFDFTGFFNRMKAAGYAGDYIIELYTNSYKNDNDIKNSKEMLENIF